MGFKSLFSGLYKELMAVAAVLFVMGVAVGAAVTFVLMR